MSTNQVFERFGGVTKEEPLTSLPKDLVLNNSQVLEAVKPFFGYYNDGPQVKKNIYLYLVLEGDHPYELFAAATERVRKRFPHPFDAISGSASTSNFSSQVIRVQDLQKFDQVLQLQELYQSEGITFKKNAAPVNNEMVVTRLIKFFFLEPHADGIFMDHLQKSIGYFRVPEYINWDDFKKITSQVKLETSLLFFDAATAFYVENCKMVNLIRIYKEHITPEMVKPIKDRYLKLLA